MTALAPACDDKLFFSQNYESLDNFLEIIALEASDDAMSPPLNIFPVQHNIQAIII